MYYRSTVSRFDLPNCKYFPQDWLCIVHKKKEKKKESKKGLSVLMKFTQQLWSRFYFENLLHAITGRSNTLFIFFLFLLLFFVFLAFFLLRFLTPKTLKLHIAQGAPYLKRPKFSKIFHIRPFLFTPKSCPVDFWI